MAEPIARAALAPGMEMRSHSFAQSVVRQAAGPSVSRASYGLNSGHEYCELGQPRARSQRPPAPAEASAGARELIALWDELLTGCWKVTGHPCDDAHCRLFLGRDERPHGAWRTISSKRRSMFESVLLGKSQKVLAIDMGRSYSTVSAVLHGCLQTLGLSCQFRNVPLSLVLLAHATRLGEALPRVSLVREVDRCILTFSRPDVVLRRRLSEVEYDVARLTLEGKSHAEMATLRRTSSRTIANQLQSIFSKLQATGRLQLLRVALDGQRLAACAEPALTAENRHRERDQRRSSSEV